MRLADHDMFLDILEEELSGHTAARDIFIKTYTKGHTLHNQGEACTALDLVLSGEAVAYSLNKSGSSLTLFTFGEGGIIGANLLYANENRYPLNLFCQTACTIAHIRLRAVERLLENKRFRTAFIRSIASNSFGMNQKMLSFTQDKLRNRLMEYLFAQSMKQGSSTIRLAVTKKQLADELGVQRPSLFRELKLLREEGIIEYSAKEITLLKKPF